MSRRHEWTDPETGIIFWIGESHERDPKVGVWSRPAKWTDPRPKVEDIPYGRYAADLAAELDKAREELHATDRRREAEAARLKAELSEAQERLEFKAELYADTIMRESEKARRKETELLALIDRLNADLAKARRPKGANT